MGPGNPPLDGLDAVRGHGGRQGRRHRCRIARTGYTGEPGVELIAVRADTEPLFDALLAARARRRAVRPRRAGHAAAGGLLPAARQRHLARDERDRGRAWAGSARSTRTSSARDVLRRVKARGRSGASWRFGCWIARSRAAGIRCSRGRAGRRGHERHAVAEPRPRYRPRLSSRGPRRARERRAGGRPRARARCRGGAEAALPEGDAEHGGRGELPRRTSAITRSTTGCGSTGTRPSSGSPGTPRTRSGRSSTTSRPRRRHASEADAPYGELESVKAVSDVIAPLAGEVVAVNQAVVESPELVNQDPYGEGWLIRVRLDDSGVGGRADGRGRLPRPPADPVGGPPCATRPRPTATAPRCSR